jgi:hypothetical protein
MRFVRLLCSFAAVSGVLAAPAGADVLVLSDDGSVRRAADPGVASVGERTAYRQVRPTAVAARRKTVISELKRMLRAGAIDEATYSTRRAEYESAVELVRRLSGRRRIEMGGTVRTIESIAGRGLLTVSRLEPLWLTLQANRKWWTGGPLLAGGRRVRVGDSEIVWQYVPGQGLQLHPLANFGKLNGLWQGQLYDDRLEQMMDELIPLAAVRAGGLAWEYYFNYGGGRGPWASGLAQGTALQALARASIRLQRKDEVLPIARQGLAIFQAAPPSGVRIPANGGAHYLIYSFNRHLRVLNGFMQALVGLNDFGAYANDDLAKQLFADGDRSAQAEIPRYDTGFWSKYSLQRESDLGYHKLVTGFLSTLCERTGAPIYCDTGTRFGEYLHEPPVVELVSERLRGATVSPLRFRVSKISRVVVRVARGSKLVLSRSALVSGGGRSFAWSVPRRKGEYVVRVTATDLAGNTSTVKGLVEVLKPKRK